MSDVITVSREPDDIVTSRELVEIAQSETTYPCQITTQSDTTTLTRLDGRTLELTIEIGVSEDVFGEEVYKLDTWRINCVDVNGDTLMLSNEFEYGNSVDEMDYHPVVDEVVEWINQYAEN